MNSTLRRVAMVAAMLTLAGTAAAISPPVAFAATAYDNIASPESITTSGSYTLNNSGATYETNEHSPYSYFDDTQGTPVNSCHGGASVWTALPNPAGTGRVNVQVTTPNPSDLVLEVWSAAIASPTIDELSAVHGLRVSQSGQQAMDVDLDPGSFYFLDEDTCNQSNATSNLTEGPLSFALTFTGRPGNDYIAAAAPLSEGQSVSSDVTGASDETSEKTPYSYSDSTYNTPVAACHGGSSRWYAVPAGSRSITLSGSANFDGVVEVWSASTPSPAPNAITGLAGLRLQAPGQTSIQKTLDPTLDYYVSADTCNEKPNVQAARAEGIVTFSVSFKVPDTTPPAITITSPAPNATFAPSSLLTVNATATDSPAGVAGVTIALAGVTSRALAPAANNSYAASFPIGTLKAGSYTIVVSSVDNAGNADQVSESVTLAGSGYVGATNGYVGASSVKGITTSKGVVKVKDGKYTGYADVKKNQSITLKFVGNRVDLHFALTRVDGLAKITIDGKSYTVDLSNAGKAKDFVKSFAHLTRGKHTVVITALGKPGKHSSSKNGIRVLLTFLRIYAT